MKSPKILTPRFLRQIKRLSDALRSTQMSTADLTAMTQVLVSSAFSYEHIEQGIKKSLKELVERRKAMGKCRVDLGEGIVRYPEGHEFEGRLQRVAIIRITPEHDEYHKAFSFGAVSTGAPMSSDTFLNIRKEKGAEECVVQPLEVPALLCGMIDCGLPAVARCTRGVTWGICEKHFPLAINACLCPQRFQEEEANLGFLPLATQSAYYNNLSIEKPLFREACRGWATEIVLREKAGRLFAAQVDENVDLGTTIEELQANLEDKCGAIRALRSQIDGGGDPVVDGLKLQIERQATNIRDLQDRISRERDAYGTLMRTLKAKFEQHATDFFTTVTKGETKLHRSVDLLTTVIEAYDLYAVDSDHDNWGKLLVTIDAARKIVGPKPLESREDDDEARHSPSVGVDGN